MPPNAAAAPAPRSRAQPSHGCQPAGASKAAGFSFFFISVSFSRIQAQIYAFHPSPGNNAACFGKRRHKKRRGISVVGHP